MRIKISTNLIDQVCFLFHQEEIDEGLLTNLYLLLCPLQNEASRNSADMASFRKWSLVAS